MHITYVTVKAMLKCHIKAAESESLIFVVGEPPSRFVTGLLSSPSTSPYSEPDIRFPKDVITYGSIITQAP